MSSPVGVHFGVPEDRPLSNKKRRILVGKIDDRERFATSSSFSFFYKRDRGRR